MSTWSFSTEAEINKACLNVAYFFFWLAFDPCLLFVLGFRVVVDPRMFVFPCFRPARGGMLSSAVDWNWRGW